MKNRTQMKRIGRIFTDVNRSVKIRLIRFICVLFERDLCARVEVVENGTGKYAGLGALGVFSPRGIYLKDGRLWGNAEIAETDAEVVEVKSQGDLAN